MSRTTDRRKGDPEGYWPRFPDLVAVCGGFIFGAGGGATGLAVFVRSTAFGRWKPARFGENIFANDAVD